MMTPTALHRPALFVARAPAAHPRLALRPRLVVGAGYRWLAVGRGERIDISRRALLRRLLAHLVERRLSSPELPSRASELIAAGWPGERIPLGCAMNRLYVALCYLRKCDLQDVLRCDPDGWYLDACIEVVKDDEPR